MALSILNNIPSMAVQNQLAIGQAPGSTVTITVAADTGRVSQAINDFVSNFNAITSAINAQFTYDQSSGSSGPLAADSSVRTVQQQLMQAISGSSVSSSQTPTLGSLGITMNNDGTLSVDNSVLNSALSSHYSDVQSFFQDPQQGFATKLSTLMNSLTDVTNGPFVVDLKSISLTQTALTSTINDFEDRLAQQRASLVTQLSQASAALQQLPTMQNEIDAMLGNLTTNNSSSK